MRTNLRKWGGIALTLLPLALALMLAQPISAQQEVPTQVEAEGGSDFTQYLPLISRPKGPSIRLDSLWATDQAGDVQQAFRPGDSLEYHITGATLVTSAITVTFQLSQAGPCGDGVIVNTTLVLPPGGWLLTVPTDAPNCVGIYTNNVRIDHEFQSIFLADQIVVRPLIQQVYSDGQGFDRCYPPSVSDMQSWWNQSPYSTFNIYLGGVHYFCWNNPMDAIWVQKVAQQGWTFTATWVGPQAPCSSFTYRMSANPSTAYQEGKTEAVAAVDAARQLGLFGQLLIHYDVEGYFGSASCADAVQSFMQGWTDKLHALGYQAGGYGGACSSLIADWWDNNPPTDQVWIAHWTDSGYNPNATVWNTPCLSDTRWPNQQRLKQYAGDHVETWDGVSMGVDSNVFDTTVLDDPGTAVESVRDFSPLGERSGWLLLGSRLLRTENLGADWVDITPTEFKVLGAAFLDSARGWVAGWSGTEDGLVVGHTRDGGATWMLSPLAEGDALGQSPIAAAYFETLDEATIWLALKLQSGSSFSVGRLFASEDGGLTWEARSHPLGEPVAFVNAEQGWTVGGPAGTQAFRTSDGGRTWEAVEIAGDLDSEAAIGLPLFTDSLNGRLHLVTRQNRVETARVYETSDGGLSWQLEQEVPIGEYTFPGSLLDMLNSLPFSEGLAGLANMPAGTIRVDLGDAGAAWALTQDGSCGSIKGSDCQQTWALWYSPDAGSGWQALLLPQP